MAWLQTLPPFLAEMWIHRSLHSTVYSSLPQAWRPLIQTKQTTSGHIRHIIITVFVIITGTFHVKNHCANLLPPSWQPSVVHRGDAECSHIGHGCLDEQQLWSAEQSATGHSFNGRGKPDSDTKVPAERAIDDTELSSSGVINETVHQYDADLVDDPTYTSATKTLANHLVDGKQANQSVNPDELALISAAMQTSVSILVDNVNDIKYFNVLPLLSDVDMSGGAVIPDDRE